MQSLLFVFLFLHPTTEQRAILDLFLYVLQNILNANLVSWTIYSDRVKKNKSYIGNQSSFLNLQTFLFNINFPVNLFLLTGELFFSNDCFDYGSVEFVRVLQYITQFENWFTSVFLILHFVNTVFCRHIWLASLSFRNGNVKDERTHDKWF